MRTSTRANPRCSRCRSTWVRWHLLMWLALATCGMLLPAGAPVRADGGAPNLAYAVGAGSARDDLAVIDIAQRRLVWRLRLGGDPRAILLSVDGRYAYVAQAAANAIALVDTSTRQIIASIPVGQAPSALTIDSGATGYLYVANSGGDSVMALDPGARAVVASIPVGHQPVAIAIAAPGSGIATPNDAELYVANSGSDTVSVVSTERGVVVATMPAPGGPLAVVIPMAGGVAYVGTRAGTVLAYRLADHRLLGTLLRLGGSAGGSMDYDGVTGEVYLPDATGGVVDELRPASAGSAGAPATLPAEPARSLSFAGAPAAVAITVDGAYGFVAERDAGRVAQFDVATHRVLATYAVGGSPRAVITGAYPPGGVYAPGSGGAPVGPPTRQPPVDATGLLVAAGVVLLLAVGTLVALRQRRGTRRGKLSH